MDFVDFCPPVVIERIRGADFASGENGTLFSWIASRSPFDCQVHSIAAVADRLNADSHRLVISDFTASVATYARFLPPDALPAITAAYLRFRYDPAIAMNYFNGLRLAGIDIRPHLRGKVVENWSFSHPRTEAATWHYYRYLASLGEPGALDKLAAKIARTENGNDATHLLRSLAELKGKEVADILRLYANDTRRSDGVEGPGTMISVNIKNFLVLQAAQ